MGNEFKLLDAKLQSIGTTDEMIREQVFEFWHLSRINQDFNQSQYDYLLEHASKLVMTDIENSKSYSVLTRSYSLLLLDCLLQADADYELYAESIYEDLNKKLIKYMQLENDFRGYELGIGWIHTLAHLSDCIYSLANTRKLSFHQKQALLGSYLELIDRNVSIYSYREDERIARALNAFSVNFDSQIISWLKSRKEYISVINVDQQQKQLLISKYRQILKALLKYDKYRDEILKLFDTMY